MSGGPPLQETLVVPREKGGMELDEFLCLRYPEFAKGFLREQVRRGAVLVDGMAAYPSQRLRTDQVLLITLEEGQVPKPPVGPAGAIPVLYEDEEVCCLDKPAGLAVEPERWARDAASLAGALVEMARERSAGAGSGGADDGDGVVDVRFRAVHRIDKETSGCLLVAKGIEAERRFRALFEGGGIEKRYLALVEGELPLEEGEEETIELPVGPDARKSGRMSVQKGGKPACTLVSVAARYRGYTLVECRPLTGRTHQIRVHLAARGFPLAVDRLYGRRESFLLSSIKAGYKAKPGRSERPLVDRLTLHALALRFPRPDGATVEVESPLPKDLSNALRQLAKHRPLDGPLHGGRRSSGS